MIGAVWCAIRLAAARRALYFHHTLPASPPIIAYLFTTFPQPTETFLQREIVAMKNHGVILRLYSLWGGGGTFRGLEVVRFNKWRLFTLLWLIPYESWRRPDVLGQLFR